MLLEVFFIRCTHVTDSSSIINDVLDMCLAGLANLAIFYFHFGDTTKQDARNLLSSILFQLCSQSDQFSQVLSSVHSSHGNGSREPSIDTLMDGLKTILALRGQAPLYIIVDALDECPNSSGIRTQRQEVLEILKELVKLKHPHVYFCVTSRPEIDIQEAFDPLNPYNVSLHNQAGQIKDLAEYVKSVVCSDAKMKNWPADVKELVIDTLAEKGGGMYVIVVLTPCIHFSCDDFRFRWAYCQLETLRHCPRRYISSTLNTLPKTLDETYERILQGIPEVMRMDAHRMFQWIMVSSHPLGVEEVAEVFAINFDEEMSGIPQFEPSWRDANAEAAVLSACSTLVTIVDDWRGKRVQFSHFSVQEYLTSDRVANAGHVSHFHIHPKPAHTLLAKACLSVLLHLDYSNDEFKIENFPLAKYAARYWVEHARFGDVSLYIDDGMDNLFDKDKPHFATWVWVYDIDCGASRIGHIRPEQHNRVPLYYAALCGFRGLVGRLLTAYPQDLDVKGGKYGAPLNAALAKGHLNIAQFLLDHDAVGDTTGYMEQTGLYIASSRGYANVVRSLIDRGADVNAECEYWGGDDLVQWTPLHIAIYEGHPDIALLLLKSGADPEARSSQNQTPLCVASFCGHADVARSLIDHGADVNAECKYWKWDGYEAVQWTSLHTAIYEDHPDIALLLLESGADPEARSSKNQTPLCVASFCGHVDVARSLIDCGADLNAKSWDWTGPTEEEDWWTPLHAAIYKGHRDVALLLLEHGSDPEIRNSQDETALHVASYRGCADIIVPQLLSRGADPNAEARFFGTPLHVSSMFGKPEIARIVLEQGVNPNALDDWGRTALHKASGYGGPEIARILLEHGTNPNTPDHSGRTALHLASKNTIVDLLLEYGANVDARDEEGWTPLHNAARTLKLQVLVALLGRGADPHALTNNGETPFQFAKTPYEWVSKEDQAEVIQLLLERTGERI